MTQLEVKNRSDSGLQLHRSSHVLLEVPSRLVSEPRPHLGPPSSSPADEPECALLLIGGLESERRACNEVFVLRLALARASGSADAPWTPEQAVETLLLDGTLRARCVLKCSLHVLINRDAC